MVTTTAASIHSPASIGLSKGLTAALWIAQLGVAGILGMGAFVKLLNYTPEGSMVLAQALGVGRGVITAIGLVEVLAVVLILVPRTRALGALLAVGQMLGALLSHATVIGFSGNAAAEMWPMAIGVLFAASFVLVMRRRELPLIGSSL